MLFPIENDLREVRELSGLWNFKIDFANEGIARRWFDHPLRDTTVMPVPASYNDIVTDAAARDHIGLAWYEKTFDIHHAWFDRRIVLRFGSVTHHATVWVNGIEVARHKGGFLPFETDLGEIIKPGQKCRITVAVDNRLDWTCLPSGQIKQPAGGHYPEGYTVQETYFDFFNYAGIHRPVRLYSTPSDAYIADISVSTDIHGSDGLIRYEARIAGQAGIVRATLFDADETLVAQHNGTQGTLTVPNARLWQPGQGYLYSLDVEILDAGGRTKDRYRLPVGIRTVKVRDGKFLINDRAFYFRGFGKHEDADIRGRGLDEALNVKDFNLLAWIGANSFRTSHYPYSEELMRLADRQGIVVIDEIPAVGMCFWSETNTVFRPDRVNETTLAHHQETLREMIARDKNHPCVVMWSIANEAATNEEAAVPYFTAVIDQARRLDPTRPITMVQTMWPSVDKVSQLVDVICLNRYWGWYSDHGQLSLIERHAKNELTEWFEKFGKPIIISEYGADTITGFHSLPPIAFSEEFQTAYLEAFHRAFDAFDFVIGEHVWAFADFATKQGLNRAGGNRKGIFTRQRQPKAAAFTLRSRWTAPHPKWP